ncbi:uncharacterized protein [Elaeis guineensis]|uniref:Uncharacterized protein LOC105032685 n=1 Tax=Elaeis guineensis var. tenera TaxID=51953 RepID=A0A6I9Q8Y6_ELAGV|nr:uncharacterized protein LOC105032685 [Elaeis guineensis]
MELAKEKDERLKLVHMALHQLLEERKSTIKDKKEEEEDLFLSRLLSQLESLQKDANNTQLPADSPNKEEPASSSSSKNKDCDINNVGMDEVVRELRRVKRQNLITHCLLFVMIIITAYWQFNEVSLLLTVKDKFSHPLRAVGDMIKGSFKGKGKKPHIEAHLPPIGVPEIPHGDLPSITLNNNALSALNNRKE